MTRNKKRRGETGEGLALLLAGVFVVLIALIVLSIFKGCDRKPAPPTKGTNRVR